MEVVQAENNLFEKRYLIFPQKFTRKFRELINKCSNKPFEEKTDEQELAFFLFLNRQDLCFHWR